MQFARSATANFKQPIYAPVYSFMPIPRAHEAYRWLLVSCNFSIRPAA